jgi:hypothetical protein
MTTNTTPHSNVTSNATVKLWAETDTTEKQRAIARDWAVRFSYKQLRAFQAHYVQKCAENTRDELVFACFDNMWWVATFAIDIREFGEG